MLLPSEGRLLSHGRRRLRRAVYVAPASRIRRFFERFASCCGVSGGRAETVTFVFSDIEGSTPLWERDPELMATVLARHDELISGAVLAQGGRVVKQTGDGVMAVFASAAAGVIAAVEAQRAIAGEAWPAGTLRVRMGVHSGEALAAGGDYFGPTLNRCARLMAAASGGQVLCTQSTVELTEGRLPADIGLHALGPHRFRGLSGPVQVWQVRHPDLPAVFPPLRSLDSAVGNLPAQLSSFVGRRQEVRNLSEELKANRLLTLTGTGGVGKTRLALEVAAEAQADHRDGTWFCELAPVGDPSAVPGVVAAAFGVVQQAGRSVVGTLVDHLSAKEAVLVLDNCEHVIEAAAAVADQLARGCSGLCVLATSREPLAVAGEVTRAVRPLSADDAVELFEERARAIDPTFVADEATRTICRRLDGIPLALEMAAARLRSMRPGEIAARLDERFRLLVGGRGVAERQQTLRATVVWSHDLLDAVERRVFRRLAVFAGSFDLGAAEAVVADDDLDAFDVDDVLARLVAKSLVSPK